MDQLDCDNEGLVKKMAALNRFRLSPSSTCLHSEWDMVHAVYRLLMQFNETPLFRHVKGHQDSDQPYRELSLPAQLNVNADAICTHEMEEYATPLPRVPLDPSSQVQLNVRGITITQCLESTIHCSTRLPQLHEYYLDRFLWLESDFEQIDWSTFGSQYQKLQSRRKFLNKFCLYQLPTGARLHRRCPKFDDRCPTCHAEHESDDHLLQCPSLSRKAWRKDFRTSTRKSVESFLDPVLLDILIDGIESYFQAVPMDSTQYPPTYRQLVDQQSSIGWNHFVRGKCSLLWQDTF